MKKQLICAAILVLMALPSAFAFSLAGPIGFGGDAWQVQNIGYGPPLDFVAPKNIGDGYRRNIPVMYYAYSAAFLEYFGTAGETNIDDAFTNILNNALSDNGAGGLGSYSTNLAEVPLDSQQYNYTAQNYQLYDIKSMVVAMMMPQLGLATPEEYVWKIEDRYLPPGATCPSGELYTIIQRNFGITPTGFNDIQYSSYINNTLYSFFIDETCTGTPIVADTVTFPVDPLADSYTSVAGGVEIFDNLSLGGFYTGLTADDIGGLRYLYNTNNVNTETVHGGSLLFDVSTNTAAQQLFPANTNTPTGFGTFNLGSLLSFATTNPPAVVAANFPGVIIASSTNYYVKASNVVEYAYYTQKIGYPAGDYVLVIVTNYTPYLQERYLTSFANIVTNYYTSNSVGRLQTITVASPVGYPAGTVTLQTNYSTVKLDVPSGSYYVLPVLGTNLCPPGILYTGLTNVIYTTNIITYAFTNSAVTNYLYEQILITSYTNYTYVTYTVNCAQDTNATGLYQGINKIQFIRSDYDSLLGQFFQPFSSGFSLVAVTNGTYHAQHFDRPVTAPDVLIDAADMVNGGGALIRVSQLGQTVPLWDTANVPPPQGALLQAGPGTIDPPIVLTFNKIGNIYLNGPSGSVDTNAFLLGQLTQDQVLAYGSFDGTTNLPVVYPDGSSIENLEAQLAAQVSPTTLANGTNGVAYPSVQFSASGGSYLAPFAWTTSGLSATGQPTSGLPPGLSLSASGLLSGTPTLAGTYDFNVTLTDSLGRTITWNYTIIIQ